MATKAPKNIKPIKADSLKYRLQNMCNKAAEMALNIDDQHVFISTGNRKTGFAVPSVSLIPVKDCGNCSSCSRLCYDIRNDMYPSVMDTRARNSAIAHNAVNRYFKEIETACKAFRFFRWHIGGDILDYNYLLGVIRVAVNNPGCSFLIFTKMYDLVNYFVEAGGVVPSNLQIIFSDWPGAKMDNPYKFPTSSPVFADGTTAAPADAIECPGDCSTCAVMGAGCWTLKAGQGVKFNAH
jgi:hypothetical protein